jgi:transcriptional regulator with XRE-family HTH domain
MTVLDNERDRDFWLSVGSQLRIQRIQKGKGLRQVARELGVSPSYISQVELGKKGIGPAMIMRFCTLYETTLDQLTSEVELGSHN